MIFFVIWFRTYVATVSRRQQIVDDKWEEALFSVVSSNDELTNNLENLIGQFHIDDNLFSRSVISKEDTPHFLYTWNYLQESLRGDARKRLNDLANKLSVEEKAISLLRSPLVKNRILAINTLGNLKAKNAYKKVSKFAFKKDPIISVWAFRAMFRIKPQKTLNEFLYLIVEREDWSPAYVAKILKTQGGNLISKKLVELTEDYYEQKLKETQMARLVSYLKFAHINDYSPVISRLLSECDQMEVLIACMRLLKTEDSLPKVRKLLKDQRWQLRMFAVMTLARFGHNEDVRHFISMLNDLNWWVRYYSARALMSIPSLSRKNIRRLSNQLPNEFQRDILKQVLAEDEFQCLNRSSSVLSS